MKGQWKLSRVVGAMQPGVGFDVYGSHGPELCLPDGSRLRLTSSLGGHKVVFKCLGCVPGHQHFKVATCDDTCHPKKEGLAVVNMSLFGCAPRSHCKQQRGEGYSSSAHSVRAARGCRV